MSNEEVIASIADHIKAKFESEGTGHDWWHMYRVWQMAKQIGEKEGVDMLIVELGALLHDIEDWKFHNGDDTVGPKAARELLETYNVDEKVVNEVVHIIENISYKGAGVENKMGSKEGFVVQDADRIDAIGAIGIARTFAYGGAHNRLIYDPNVSPTMHQTKEAYAKDDGHTINHFYEKLLLLKDRMNTKTGKEIAEERHAFLEKYLEQFYKEWNVTE